MRILGIAILHHQINYFVKKRILLKKLTFLRMI
jgi:hypothetical protein